MSSWKTFERQAPDIAAFGKKRFQSTGGVNTGGANPSDSSETSGETGRPEAGVAYLATLRPDGGPRVHPVTPVIGEQLFVFMEPTSPKGKDLVRDARYALHCAMSDSSGGSGEFYVRGRAELVSDPLLREQAVQACPYVPQAHYILFLLSVDFAFMNQYVDGQPNTRRWQASD